VSEWVSEHTTVLRSSSWEKTCTRTWRWVVHVEAETVEGTKTLQRVCTFEVTTRKMARRKMELEAISGAGTRNVGRRV